MDFEEQYDEWRREYANRLFKAGEAVRQMALYSPDDANEEWYVSRAAWFQKEADEVWPPEHSWPKDCKAEIYDLATRKKVNI